MEEDSEEEAVTAGDLVDLAEAAAEAVALQETGSAGRKEWIRNALHGNKTDGTY